MWWIILLLLMLAIAYVLWLRAKLDREWRLELAYLSRHVGTEDAAATQPDKLATPLHKVGPNLTHWRAHAQASAANQAVWARVQAQLQQVNPRAKAAAALSEDDKARLASEETLAELPIFAQTLPANDAQPAVTETEAEAETAAAVVDRVPAAKDAVSQVQNQPPAEAGEPNVLTDPNVSTDAVDATEPLAPAADLEVITLAEATRQVAGRLPQPAPPLEMVELNWPLPSAQADPQPAAEPAEVITLADPALSRICARTEAERAALRQADTAAQAALPAAVSAPVRQTIGEDDIRTNLLRQRLARRREAGVQTVSAPTELAVIAEDEVLANLAKTDSPVNRQKHVFKRATVRESVIPAAARIGHSHTVGWSPLAVPVTASADQAAPAPISTRFTPFDAPIAPPHEAESAPASQPVLDFFADTEAAFSATEDQAMPEGAVAEPMLHITDAPSWSIRDRLLSESAGSESVSAQIGLPENPPSASTSASTATTAVSALPAAAAVAAPLPPTPAWTPAPVPSDNEAASVLPVTDPDRAVWGGASVSLAGAATPATEPLTDADVAPPWTEADAPEWQQTLDQALADADANANAAAAVVPLQAGAEPAAMPAQQPGWGRIQPNRLQAAAVPAPVPARPAMAPTTVPAAGSDTAMGLALQAAMQQAAAASPATAAVTIAPASVSVGLPENWPLPGLDLLLPPQFNPEARQSEEALLENSITIEEKLAEFKVKVSVVDAYAGPVITRYEIEPAQGVRGNQVVNLEKDLARSLGFAAIRVVETIPGKTCMGLELPNPKRQVIRLSEIFNAPAFRESRSKLTLALGQDITGEPVVTDLARAPHLLVAGTTGSGKSVGVNAMILSMLFKAAPEEVRLIMIDPKMLELSIYEGIPHLLAPVVTDMKLAANALTWCVNEMEKRYRLMSHLGVRNLAGFNQKVAEAAQRGHKLANPFSLTPDDPEPLQKLPFIVVVVDEFADLMMTAGKKIEELIARLAQKARAAGIHLILATQRPSVDVITGLIKANIPTRIAFQVSSKIDSRTILDQMGAENLLGQGDMLFLPPGTGYPRRVHGAFVADEEVHGVVEYLKQFGEPNYIDDILTAGVGEDDLFSNANGARSNEGEDDPLYDEAVAVVLKTRKASISSVQRQLRIGYNRAARLVEQMEADGIVSAAEGNGNRTVLAPSAGHLDE